MAADGRSGSGSAAMTVRQQTGSTPTPSPVPSAATRWRRMVAAIWLYADVARYKFAVCWPNMLSTLLQSVLLLRHAAHTALQVPLPGAKSCRYSNEHLKQNRQIRDASFVCRPSAGCVAHRLAGPTPGRPSQATAVAGIRRMLTRRSMKLRGALCQQLCQQFWSLCRTFEQQFGSCA